MLQKIVMSPIRFVREARQVHVHQSAEGGKLHLLCNYKIQLAFSDITIYNLSKHVGVQRKET